MNESKDEYRAKSNETFVKELEYLINRYSQEQDSNTPDFILAEYLNNCLQNFAIVVEKREKWHGREPHPLHTRYGVPIE